MVAILFAGVHTDFQSKFWSGKSYQNSLEFWFWFSNHRSNLFEVNFFFFELNLFYFNFLGGWGWNYPPPPCIKLVRIMLETSNLARKYTLIYSFRKDTFRYKDSLNFADVIIFFEKNQRFWAKIVPLLKAIMRELC